MRRHIIMQCQVSVVLLVLGLSACAGQHPASPEALIAATRTNAQILDMGDKPGTLEPGKLADLIVIEGKPDENLQDLGNFDLDWACTGKLENNDLVM